MCENLPRRSWLGFCSRVSCWFDMLAQTNSFRGFKAFGIFLLFGAAMAGLAGATTDLAQPFSRSSVGVERTGIPPARTLREWRGRGLPGARRRSGDGRSRLVPSPVLGLGLGSCPGRNPDRGKRGERHPGRFPAGGSRVDSCGRDTLCSSPSASANRFLQKGFSRPSKWGEPVSLRKPGYRASSYEVFRLARLRARKMRAFQSAR